MVLLLRTLLPPLEEGVSESLWKAEPPAPPPPKG